MKSENSLYKEIMKQYKSHFSTLQKISNDKYYTWMNIHISRRKNFQYVRDKIKYSLPSKTRVFQNREFIENVQLVSIPCVTCLGNIIYTGYYKHVYLFYESETSTKRILLYPRPDSGYKTT